MLGEAEGLHRSPWYAGGVAGLAVKPVGTIGRGRAGAELPPRSGAVREDAGAALAPPSAACGSGRRTRCSRGQGRRADPADTERHFSHNKALRRGLSLCATPHRRRQPRPARVGRERAGGAPAWPSPTAPAPARGVQARGAAGNPPFPFRPAATGEQRGCEGSAAPPGRFQLDTGVRETPRGRGRPATLAAGPRQPHLQPVHLPGQGLRRPSASSEIAPVVMVFFSLDAAGAAATPGLVSVSSLLARFSCNREKPRTVPSRRPTGTAPGRRAAFPEVFPMGILL